MVLHVTNLQSNVIETDLLRLFSRFGEVTLVKLVRDKLNNRSLGHAFVDMPAEASAKEAINQTHKTSLQGKVINVAAVNYDPAPNASWSFSQDA